MYFDIISIKQDPCNINYNVYMYTLQSTVIVIHF